MARTTFVKHAQARYATVPVIDPKTGQQKVTPVMKKDGTQKVTKSGKAVVLRVTKADKSKPLPNRKCDACRKEIKPGDPYKHISPKSGPYGGRTLVRCASCPQWQVWDYSSSLSAQLSRISFDAAASLASISYENADDVTSVLSEAAEAVREIAQQKEESAENIREGFGHDTFMSEELDDVAQQLNDWADEIEQAEIPEPPEPEEQPCETCDETGMVVNEEFDADAEGADEHDASETCPDCDGTGQIMPDEPTEEQMDDWRNDVESALQIIDESPV